jgi:hypothetical protein
MPRIKLGAVDRLVDPKMVLPAPEPRGSWGGRREGAGRPRTPGGRKTVAHRAREAHDPSHPVHITLAVRSGVGSLRRRAPAEAIETAIRSASHDGGAAATRRRGFRVVYHAIQADRLHLIVEASSQDALGRGMGGLASRLARRVNRALGREGKLFEQRYLARPLTTPADVRRALVDPPRPSDEPSPVVEPQTALLRAAWRRLGLLRRSAP